MQKMLVTSALFVMLLTSFNSFAISEAYRKQLDASGCTQMSDAAGDCTPHHSQSPNISEADRRSGPALPGPAAEVRQDLENKVVGKFLGQAVDIMTAKGWSRTNQDGITWEKAGFIVSLVQGGSGQIKAVKVR